MATRRDSENPDLKAETIAVLLAGWSASPPADVEPGPHGFCGGMLDLFEHDGPETLWRQHEQFLRTVAASWQWEPDCECADGRRRFWAEARSDGFEG